jgi:exodeoxyribonuclease VII small subunit
MANKKAKPTAKRSAGKSAKADSPLDFRKSYQELEQIVAWFEGDDLDLDESLAKFERGLELAAACQARLKLAENRILEIRERFRELD